MAVKLAFQSAMAPAVKFFVLSLLFVQRSFFSMRIAEDKDCASVNHIDCLNGQVLSQGRSNAVLFLCLPNRLMAITVQ
ncbi:MAG: hypothetical protein HGB06_07445 [Chlorobaculum sp.]|nr:hypothetical protein [Chlorobaculum sp.]